MQNQVVEFFRTMLTLSLTAATLNGVAFAQQSERKQPNILFIMTDQQPWTHDELCGQLMA